MPTISADALKRMLNLPANVVAVPVRPYAGDMDRCARCGERGRPYDRLGVRRWRHLDIGARGDGRDGAVGQTQERVHA